ncbi:MAG: hypothetical protein HYW33_02665 [Candidatus Blackburnbacteria bacterium]|nr:hypothetical protein [Candidatus Blackburnbacteria bacterium]
MEPTINNGQVPAEGVSPLQPVQPAAGVVPTPTPADQPASDPGLGGPASPEPADGGLGGPASPEGGPEIPKIEPNNPPVEPEKPQGGEEQSGQQTPPAA